MAQAKPRRIRIEIDREHYDLEDRPYTVRELLELSENDPETTYLIDRKDKDEHEYRDPNEELTLKNGMRFVTGDVGPAPVA